MSECRVFTEHSNHNFDWDLSQICPECGIKEVDFYEKELAKLRKGNEILRKSLIYISAGDDNDDVETAEKALKEYAELMGDSK